MPASLISAHSHVDDDWLTAREASGVARVAEKTLANWRSRGVGPPYKKLSAGRGGRIRYRRGDVIAWLNGERIESAA
ncbi:helix-turn-helix domain-containing protein [Streptomyces sp. NBC_01142]|uniref:helix-turn-helix domain-containing protein n=1 Tax=Streptomyces sp. NBC_01142 TaxID=2975865 RepID=UPI0022561576|nr:helix-turn-helix domain-containing protein [Streptomyces sp. NBC_01142]MCX4824893.1 helix-turn-helix domain-containing protein [Streptomyces sp. NBC_01142]